MLHQPRPAISALRKSKAYSFAWWTFVSLALVSLISAAVMFAPPDRKNQYLQPELASDVATPASIAALILLVTIMLVPIPRNAVAQGAAVVFGLTGGIVLLLLGYRLIAGASDSRDFLPEQLVPAVPLLWLALVPLIVFVVRAERIRRAGR